MQLLTEELIKDLLARQRQFFSRGATLSYDFRRASLLKLKAAILNHQTELEEALYKDLGKNRQESYTSEIGFVSRDNAYFETPEALDAPRQGKVDDVALSLLEQSRKSALRQRAYNRSVQLSLPATCRAAGCGSCRRQLRRAVPFRTDAQHLRSN